MNQDNNPQAGMNLPQPVSPFQSPQSPSAQTAAAGTSDDARNSDQVAHDPNSGQSAAASHPSDIASASVAQPPVNSPGGATWLPPTVPVQSGEASAKKLSVPATAQDGDLIEAEWVLKAEEIIARTKTDPHEQTLEISKLRAEYLKKRYDKTIVVPEES